MSFTSVSVTGTVYNADGSPAACATVALKRSAAITDGTIDVLPTVLTETTAEDGTFEFSNVVPNDDSTTTPTGTYYRATIIDGDWAMLDNFNVVISHTDAPSVDLFSLTRVNVAGQPPLTYGISSFNGRTGAIEFEESDLPIPVLNAIVVPMPAPTGVNATDTAALAAAQTTAAAIVATDGHPVITFQTGTYALPGGVQVQQGVSYLGEPPGISQINQGAGYLPDGEWNYISGTVLKGNVGGSPTGDAIWANTTSPGSFNPNTLGATQISGCRIAGFGIDGYVNGLHIGALNIMGLVWSQVDEIYAKNCSGWGIYMVNYQHVAFGKISTCLCTNGQYYGSAGAATYFNPGNSTFRDLFHKSINTTGQARNVVFEANSWNSGSPGSISGGSIRSLQVNAYNQHPATQTITLTSGNPTLAATSGAGLAVGMPCTFATSGGGISANIVYIIQSVSGNNFTIGLSNQSAAIVPNANTTLSMTSGVYAGLEIQAVQANGLINGRFEYIDVEGSPLVGVYTENAKGVELNIHAAPGVGIVGRGSANSRFQSEAFGLVTDFDNGCGGSSFAGPRATPLQYPLAGLIYDTTRGPASALSIGLGNSGSGGGDLESRVSNLIYPALSGVAQHITAQGGSKTLSPFQCGTVVVPVGSGSGITFTLATIVTQTTAGAQASSNVGLWHEIINLSSNALTVATNGSQLFNRVAALTSLTLAPGVTQKFIAMEDNSSTQYWLALPPVPVSGSAATYSAPGYAATGLTGATAASRFVGATVSGAPAAGTFAVGDYVIDQSGSLWICTTAGTPGTWTVIAGVTPPPSANFRFMPSAVSQWYCNPLMAGERTIVPTTGNMAVHIFQAPPEGLTIDKLDVNVGTVGSSGAVTRMGLYAVTNQTSPFKWASTVAYASLLVDAGTVATDSGTGQKVITLGTPQVIAGYQWFGVAGVDQVATAATRSVGGTAGALWPSPFGNLGAGGYNVGAGLALEVGSISGALPSTFSPGALQATDSGVGIHRSA